MVRLVSMAMTGYYRTMMRPRANNPLSMLKYDPIGTFAVSQSLEIGIVRQQCSIYEVECGRGIECCINTNWWMDYGYLE